MKRILFLFLIVLVVACSDNEKNSSSYCNVENPVEDLEWLRTEIEESNFINPSTMLDAFVYHAIYAGQSVFYISICCPSCNVAAPSVHSCDGEVLGTLGVDITAASLQNQSVIWRTHNGVCP